jgi:hypothetical protein
VNPVRVMIRGKHLAGATLACGRLTCTNLKVNAAGTYVFADVRIPGTASPGKYPLTLRTAAGTADASFEITAPLPRRGRFQGFGSDDVFYLVMPDRFANGDPSNDDPARSAGMHDRRQPKYYHGGDLRGIRQRLPYLKSLGITALWLNPVYDNIDRISRIETPAGQADYHGYGAVGLLRRRGAPRRPRRVSRARGRRARARHQGGRRHGRQSHGAVPPVGAGPADADVAARERPRTIRTTPGRPGASPTRTPRPR